MSDRFRRRRHWQSTSTSCILLLAASSSSTPNVDGSGIFPGRLHRKPTTTTTTPHRRRNAPARTTRIHPTLSSSPTLHSWRPRGGSVLSSAGGTVHDPTSFAALVVAVDNEPPIMDSFRSEIRAIVAECQEDMQTILHELQQQVQRELQWRNEQKAVRRERIEAELSEEDFDDDEADGDEDLEGLIKLDVFSELRETENLVDSEADEDEILDDFLVGDTDEEDGDVVGRLAEKKPSSTKVDNAHAVDEEEEMIDHSVLQSAPDSSEEDSFSEVRNDADQELVRSGSIPLRAKLLKKNKNKHIETQDTTNIHPESVVDMDISADEALQSDGVADGDESARSSDDDWQSRRSLSKKREKRKDHTAKTKDDTLFVDDDRTDSLEALTLTKKPSKFVRRSELIVRQLIFAMIGLLAAMVIYTIFDLVIPCIRHFGFL